MSQVALELELYKCQSCGGLQENQPAVCPSCLGTSFVEQSVAGAGTLASWTTIRKPALAFREHGAFDVAVVDLDAGLRVTGRIKSHDHQKVGDHVVLVDRLVIGDQPINVFERVC